MNYKFYFSCIDNGGKKQIFSLKAKDKPSAIEKGMKKAKRNAAGDIISWDCRYENSAVVWR